MKKNSMIALFVLSVLAINVTLAFAADPESVPGNLEVSKYVNWNGFPPDESQEFEICITGPTYPTGSCVSLGDGNTVNWLELTPGEYTITETDPGDTWIVSGTGAVQVVAGQTTSKLVVNKYQPKGALQVTKNVDWNGHPPIGSQVFEICITGPTYPAGSCVNLGDGQSATWLELTPGGYNVTETYPGNSWTVSGTGGIQVVSGQTASKLVINTYQLKGTLQVTKNVDWNGHPPIGSQVFEICITGPTYPSGSCVNLGDGQSANWLELTPGEYNVTETDPGDTWIVSGTGAVQVVADQTTSKLIVNNYQPKGALQVTKNVNWNGFPPDESQVFEICITGPSYPTASCVDLGDGQSATWLELTPGNYNVTETDPGDEWTVSGIGVVEVPAGQMASKTVFNKYQPKGALQVTKNVDWNGCPPDESQVFEICITGPSYPTGSCVNLGDGQSATWLELTPGNYNVTETDPGDLWTVSGNGIVAVPAGQKAYKTVVNTHDPLNYLYLPIIRR